VRDGIAVGVPMTDEAALGTGVTDKTPLKAGSIEPAASVAISFEAEDQHSYSQPVEEVEMELISFLDAVEDQSGWARLSRSPSRLNISCASDLGQGHPYSCVKSAGRAGRSRHLVQRGRCAQALAR
jgi:hypothetical protein